MHFASPPHFLPKFHQDEEAKLAGRGKDSLMSMEYMNKNALQKQEPWAKKSVEAKKKKSFRGFDLKPRGFSNGDIVVIIWS